MFFIYAHVTFLLLNICMSKLMYLIIFSTTNLLCILFVWISKSWSKTHYVFLLDFKGRKQPSDGMEEEQNMKPSIRICLWISNKV